MKHPVEGEDSWNAYLSRHGVDDAADQAAIMSDPSSSSSSTQGQRNLRRLTHKHRGEDDDDDQFDPIELETLKFEEDEEQLRIQSKLDRKKQKKAAKKRKQRFKELYQNPGIEKKTVHGLMVRSLW